MLKATVYANANTPPKVGERLNVVIKESQGSQRPFKTGIIKKVQYCDLTGKWTAYTQAGTPYEITVVGNKM